MSKTCGECDVSDVAYIGFGRSELDWVDGKWWCGIADPKEKRKVHRTDPACPAFKPKGEK